MNDAARGLFVLLLVLAGGMILWSAPALPDPVAYWLARQRRARAVSIVRHYLTHCASILLVFLAYAHWLVVRANARVPPSMPLTWVFGGLLGLAVAILLWTHRFLGAFRV